MCKILTFRKKPHLYHLRSSTFERFAGTTSPGRFGTCTRSPLEIMYPFYASSHLRLGSCASRRVDRKGQFNERVSSVLEIVICQWFNTREALKNCKGTILLKVNFIGPISITFEFSRQNDMHFSLKIDVSIGQIWLKLTFCTLEIVKNTSFDI